MFSIEDNFKVGFKNECDLLEDDFPKPSIQMEISVEFPWVLHTRNTYEE